MQLLYDSDQYVVIHMDPLEDDETTPLDRSGFELVDKDRGVLLYLDGALAESFNNHILAWQAKTPSQDDVEAVLEGYLHMAHIPVLQH